MSSFLFAQLYRFRHVSDPIQRQQTRWADFLNTARALTIYSDPNQPPDLWGVQLPGAWTSGFEWSRFGIAASSPHKEAAWRFIRFASGEQAASTWA